VANSLPLVEEDKSAAEATSKPCKSKQTS